MPGSIQVSVLGLMDLPSPPPLSSLSLKVFMGKREYHTVGDRELSFPVVSLRENLIVVMHDALGEEILRTEFRTMLLLERGFWETLFPLKNGGSINMKLQFLLSAEDHKRIREMRDSALKKKTRMENLWARHKRSLADNRIGGSISTNARIITEEVAIDHSELTDPGFGPYLDQRDKFLARRSDAGGSPRSVFEGERDAGNLDFPQTICKSFSSGSLPQISSQGKSNLMESFLLKKKCETKNDIPAMNYGFLGTKDLKIDKEIHKLEIGMEDIKLTENTSSHADSPYSAPSNSSITIDNVDTTIGTGKSTVLVVSAGTFDEINDFSAVNVEEGYSTRPILLNPKVVGEKEYLNLMQKEDGSLDLNTESCTFKAKISSHSGAELPASFIELWAYGNEQGTSGRNCNSSNQTDDRSAHFSGGVNIKTETMDANKNNNEQRSHMGKFTPLNKMVDELEMIEHPCQQCLFVEVARTGNDECTLQNASNELAASDELKTETRDANKNNIEQRSHIGKFTPLNKMVDELEMIEHPYQQSFFVEVTTTGNDESTSQNASNELAASDELKTAVKKHNSRNWSGDGNATSSVEVNRKTETVYVNENNNEEQNLRGKSLPSKKSVDDSEKIEHPNQEDSSVELGRTMNKEIMSQIPSDKHADPVNSYKKVVELKCGYNSVCSIGLLGTWTSRHLCITTRSKLFRDFAESFFVSSETNLIENSSIRDADTKVQKCGEEYLQGNESMVHPSFMNSFTVNSPSSLKSNGGLIQQGVRIVVIIVACGLLLKNS